METSRERILKAINHVPPETTPVHIMGFEGIERWLDHFAVKDESALRDKLGLDLQIVPPVYHGPNAKLGLSIWGTGLDIMGYKGSGYSQARGDYPLAGVTSVADIERFTWPDPADFDCEITAQALKNIPEKARCTGIRYAIQSGGMAREDAVRVRGNWLPLICMLYELFGLEEALVKLHTEPKIIEAAIAHIEEFYLGLGRRCLEATKGVADIFWFGDDFATHRGIMISPEQWRRFLKPTYRKLFALAKGYGVKVWFHCCGTFREVMPDLIDIGMDVWETVQVHLVGNEPEVLKREYGQDITFYGAINSQYTLPFGTSEDVRAEVRERLRVLGKGGGYILGGDHTILPDVPVENILAMVDEARKFHP